MFLMLVVAAIAGAPAESETPASVRTRAEIDYPAACTASGESGDPERVVVTYVVDSNGRARDVRVSETTNDCFNEAALAAVRNWTFEPRRVNGKAVDGAEMESTLKFVLGAPAASIDRDARPFVRIPPYYPEICMQSADKRETVLIEFDVSPEGRTENIRVVESTGKCFNRSATESVAKWRYQPKIVDGVAVSRKAVQTYVTYELNTGDKTDFPRPIVAQKLNKVRQRLLRKNPEYEKLLAELDAIEAQYGADFRYSELSSFYPLRGTARLGVKDYRGALDDLRIATGRAATEEGGDALIRTIGQLEAHVAAEDAALARAAAENDADGTAAKPQPD